MLWLHVPRHGCRLWRAAVDTAAPTLLTTLKQAEGGGLVGLQVLECLMCVRGVLMLMLVGR